MVHWTGRRERGKGVCIFFAGCLAILACMGNALGADIRLAWDPNPAPEGVSGYKIHYGPASGHYDHVEDAGNVTQY